MNELTARYMTDFLQQPHLADVVVALTMIFASFSPQAAEVFRIYFATASLYKVYLVGELGNDNTARIMSGLQENESVTEIALCGVGLQGAAGCTHIAALLFNNTHLKELICCNLVLRPEAAVSLRPSLLTNHTLHTLCFFGCRLGDQGVAVIVDSILHEGRRSRSGIRILILKDNGLTFDCIPHLARLISGDLLKRLDLGTNPQLFRHENKTGPLFHAISEAKSLRRLLLRYCQLSSHAMISLFQVFARGGERSHNDNNRSSTTSLTELDVHDHRHAQSLQEEEGQQGLARLLEIIPHVQNLHWLRIDLDFQNSSVVSSFHGNSSIQYLYTGDIPVEITEGPILDTLKRNRNLWIARQLLYPTLSPTAFGDVEKSPTALGDGDGVWAKAIERLAQDNSSGASATYKILCEKLPSSWWLPKGDDDNNNSSNNIDGNHDRDHVENNDIMDKVECHQTCYCLPFCFGRFPSRRPDIFHVPPPPKSY
jgi:hypothetical protein